MITISDQMNVLLFIGSIVVILLGLIGSFWFIIWWKNKLQPVWRFISFLSFIGCEFLGAFMLYKSGIRVDKFSSMLQGFEIVLVFLMMSSFTALFIFGPKNRKLYKLFVAIFSISLGLNFALLFWVTFC